MRVRQQWGKFDSDKAFSKKHVLVGGISSFAVIVAAAGTAAYSNSNSQSLEKSGATSNTTETKSEVNISDGQFDTNVVTSPAEDVVSESYTETGDGQSTTKQYSTTTQDQNGNKTTQEHSYTTNTDGSSAVDINLNSSSTSSGSVNSSSSVNVDVNSSTRIESSGP